MITEVQISSEAKKQLRKVPRHIVVKFLSWVDGVEVHGLEEMRKSLGYHDEPLKGARSGQRSICLSRSYRAIYTIRGNVIEFVYVEEVHKHDY